MKLSDGFDARRLRPREPSHWPSRIGAMVSALFAVIGVLLAIAGIAGLFGHSPALGELNASPGGSAVLLIGGLLVLWISVRCWRRCRARRHRAQALNLSPHLMKKSD